MIATHRAQARADRSSPSASPGRARARDHRLARSGLLVAAMMMLGPISIARAASRDLGLETVAGASSALGLARGTTVLRLDADAVRAFGAGDGGRLTIPRDGGATFDLDLERFDVFAPGAVITGTGDRGPVPARVEVALFRGRLAGDPSSRAFVSISARGMIGVIETQGRRYVLAPTRSVAGPGEFPLHAIAEESAIASPVRGPFHCDADLLAPRGALALPEARVRGDHATSTTRLTCDLAIDCDYEFYADEQNSDLSSAVAYVATLIGVVSQVYENDVDVSVRINYLNVWTTSADPYNQSSTQTELPEFTSWWNAHHADVSRHVATLLSGRYLGGGIANLITLCQRDQSYNVCQLDGYYTYPTPTATWDAMVVAHELGHNFGSRHTHSCFWQDNGYAPPGALLDSCYTAEGGCYSGPVGILPPNKGTIMSYCHQVAGVANGIRMEFHDACKAVMRGYAEQCLPVGAYEPGVQISAVAAGHDVQLSWNPAPFGGVMRYDVYRSTQIEDLAPELAGSSTGTSYVDAHRLGRAYYRLRVVRAADQSAYTNEVGVTVCGPGAPASYDVGTLAHSPVVADFNHDGRPDVVVANSNSVGSVGVIYGQSGGTLGASASFPAGNRPNTIAVGDWNEDGITDLAVTNNQTTGTFSILLGNGSGGVGDGTFAAPVAYGGTQSPLGIVAGDFDWDGITDLAIANNSLNTIAVYRGNGTNGVGDGTFVATSQTYPVGSRPMTLVTGDFNRDGALDLAVSDYGLGRVSVLLGNKTDGRADGTFGTAVHVVCGAKPYGLVTGDFNHDGITDLAAANDLDPGYVSVMLGQGSGGVGDGTFANATLYPAGSLPQGLAAGDLNGDGITDLLIADSGTNAAASVLLGTGTGSVGDGGFGLPIPVSGGETPADPVIADLDQDGVPDLVVANSASAYNLWMLPGACGPDVGTALTLIAPNGGENWAGATTHAIQWSKGPGVVSVNVDVSRDGGVKWQTIATQRTGTSFDWTVTDPPSTAGQARVRIYDPAVSRADTSDQGFTISPDIRLDVPNDATRNRLAIAVANPIRGAVRIRFALPRARPASLELMDVSGRRLVARAVGDLGAGSHTLDLARGLRAGIYLVRLSQGDERITSKVAVLE
jgi:hypothetical protein